MAVYTYDICVYDEFDETEVRETGIVLADTFADAIVSLEHEFGADNIVRIYDLNWQEEVDKEFPVISTPLLSEMGYKTAEAIEG